MLNKRETGAAYEKLARLFLEKQGLRFIDANRTFKGGELDLIMQDGTTIVFVEVRQRSNDQFGSAIESISKSKQRSWIIAAELYLLSQKMSLDTALCRFDLITFEPENDEPNWFINFIEFDR